MARSPKVKNPDARPQTKQASGIGSALSQARASFPWRVSRPETAPFPAAADDNSRRAGAEHIFLWDRGPADDAAHRV
jgi:hypothetical protein